MAALIYEVTWIRPITAVYTSTVYVVAIILTSFMLGLAIGGKLMGRFTDRIERPLFLYSLLQIGIGLFGLLLLSLFNILPVVFQELMEIHTPLRYHLIQFFSVFFLLLIPTTLMGATFPLISKSYIRKKIGKGIGEIYSVNNLGAIIGSLLAGFILIPALGIRYTIIIAALLNILTAFFILFSYHRKMLPFLIPPFSYCSLSLPIAGIII